MPLTSRLLVPTLGATTILALASAAWAAGRGDAAAQARRDQAAGTARDRSADRLTNGHTALDPDDHAPLPRRRL